MQVYKRGFFCSDLSLRYPYRECTITVPMLLVFMLLLPMLFIAVVEIMRICKHFRMRQYIVNAWRSLATFSFGFIVTYLTTEVAKNAIGRLRPHFYTACKPRMPNGNQCPDIADLYSGISSSSSTGLMDAAVDRGTSQLATLYIEQYYCSNRNLSSSQIRELHVSFPSAHSSLSFYAMLFVAFYLHAVWRGRGGTCRTLKHILQFLFLLFAWYISLSRVADYWHHWSDVLAGGVMGVTYAIITAVYVGGLLRGTNNNNNNNNNSNDNKMLKQQLPGKHHKLHDYTMGDYEKPQHQAQQKCINQQTKEHQSLMTNMVVAPNRASTLAASRCVTIGSCNSHMESVTAGEEGGYADGLGSNVQAAVGAAYGYCEGSATILNSSNSGQDNWKSQGISMA